MDAAAGYDLDELALIEGEDRYSATVEAREDFYFYTRYMYYCRNRHNWLHNWHHQEVADALMKVYRGEITRLIINEPPRYSKTAQAVVDFISWCMGKHPDSEFIHTSYSARLATNNSFAARETVLIPEYREIFPDTILRKDSKAKDEWHTTAGGKVYATGNEGTLTGYGAGKKRPGFGGGIIIDDPIKPTEAVSDTIRANVIDWFSNTLSSRVNSPHTPIILIMQRLHENDLSGWLLNGGNGEKWEHLCIPAINEAGEALWPATHDIDKLRRMELANPYDFAGQYMQTPAPKGGGMFKEANWKYWREWSDRERWPTFQRIVQSWDTAFKDGQQNDYSVCTTWGETATHYYIIDIFREKLQAPALRRKAKDLADRFKPNSLLIEDKASGQSLIQDLRTDTRLPVIAVQKNKDKIICANEVIGIQEAGKVVLPEGHPEVKIFVHEHSMFPNGAFDDTVDSHTQALKYMVRGNTMVKVQLGGM